MYIPRKFKKLDAGKFQKGGGGCSPALLLIGGNAATISSFVIVRLDALGGFIVELMNVEDTGST